MKTKIYLLFLIIAIFPLQLFSQTYLSGLISVDSTLTKDKSPYVIDNHLIINSSTLTIESGVTILFDDYYILSVINGNLIANGEVEDSIFISSNKESKNQDDWNSIEFTENSKGNLKYVNFSYSNKSLKTNYGLSSIQIQNCTFTNCTYGLYLDNMNNGNISNCLFKNNTNGAWATWGNISNCSFVDNTVGVEGGAISLNNDTLVGNNQALFITGDLIKVSKCLFDLNDIAVKYIALSHGEGYIKNSIFQNNNIAIQFSSEDKNNNNIGTINYNDFIGNKEYNIKVLSDGSDSPTILDLKNNWWGNNNKDTIESSIFDYFDNSSSSIIIEYEPYADSSINTTTDNDINYVETIKNQDFIIYPNPFSNELYLKSSIDQNIEEFRIFSIDGKLLLNGECNSLKSGIQTSNFKKGLYVLQLSINKEILNFKIIKN